MKRIALMIVLVCCLLCMATANAVWDEYEDDFWICKRCGKYVDEYPSPNTCPKCGASQPQPTYFVLKGTWSSIYAKQKEDGYVLGGTFTLNEHMYGEDNVDFDEDGNIVGDSYLGGAMAVLLYNGMIVDAYDPKARENDDEYYVAKIEFKLGKDTPKGKYKIQFYKYFPLVHDGYCYYTTETEVDLGLKEAGVEISEKNFPDPVFREKVVREFDTNASGTLSEAEIAAVEEITIFGFENKIVQMTGIGYFSALKWLGIYSSPLEGIDLSKNAALKELTLSDCGLTELDISHNPNLVYFDCSENKLTTLNVSKNTILEVLWCYSNRLSSLNILSNTKLERLSCRHNDLTELDVHTCPILYEAVNEYEPEDYGDSNCWEIWGGEKEDNIYCFLETDKDVKIITSVSEEQMNKIKAFVTRCYKVILGRSVDEQGLKDWSAALANGTAQASQIIDGIMNSQEYKNKKLSHEASVKVLYQAMLGRDADSAGLAAWKKVLDEGYPFGSVINGFCGSAEFIKICDDYGIQPGSVNIGPVNPQPAADTPRGKIEAFVKRCYNLILSRDADQSGLKGWSDALEKRTASAAQIIDGFVRSPEYLGRNFSAGESVDILYNTMLGRAADASGKAGWVDALSKGYTLQHIINGFCGSVEFTNICNDYGITPGSVAVSGVMVKREAITPEGDEAEAPVVYKGYNSEFINEEKIRAFVEHCYVSVFGREGDAEGVENYTKAILDGKKSLKKVAYEFVFSSEFQEKLPGNEEFIRILYRLYFNREADIDGLTGWVQMLENGVNLEDIVNGFAGSAEFKAIVNRMKE